MFVHRAAARHRTGYRIAVAALGVLALFVRLWDLDHLPSDLYGDIAIVYEYVAEILKGRWPTYFVLSAGPLYHYLIAPVAWLTGLQFYGLKLASVLVSLGAIWTLGRLSRELVDDTLALLAMAVASVGSWLLIFSRLGNSQILLPVLCSAALLFSVRFAAEGRQGDLVASTLVSALGLYVYPPTFILPGVTFLVLAYLQWARTAVRAVHLLWYAGLTLCCALPFAVIVASDPGNFVDGYIGGKIRPDGGLLSTLGGNILRGLLALHWRGDVVHRSNPPLLPHLDPVSGALFVFGLAWWMYGGRRRWLPVLLIPFLLLQLPSMLVLRFPREVPSASRTLGVAPIAYLFVASGLYPLVGSVGRWRRIAWLLAGVLLVLMAYLNVQRYWGSYVAALPDRNVSYGRAIAAHIDRLPPGTPVYMIGCCWSAGYQPEPKSVEYVTARPGNFDAIESKDADCAWLASLRRPTLLIWASNVHVPSSNLRPCWPDQPSRLYVDAHNRPIFRYMELPP